MSNFERVLSGDEIANIVFPCDWSANKDQQIACIIARELEQAVLSKLAEQEPVAIVDYFDGVVGLKKLIDTLPKGMKLYTHPTPNSQGILDSSKTITKENLPPLPEPHCKHGGGIGYFDSYSKEQMIEYAKSAIDRHKAMLAAPQPTNSAQNRRNLIRALALKNGFTLKGEDLHEYVYNFANELAGVVVDSSLFDKSTKNHVVGNNEMVGSDHIPDVGQMIPEGYALVPVEITAEMLRDAHIRSELGAYAVSNLSEGYSLIRNLYDVLVASAPKYTGEK